MPHRSTLLTQLNNYIPCDDNDSAVCERFRIFVDGHADCFERSLSHGHITASAWVVDSDIGMVLLVSHRKLNKWLQPGGHADGCSDVFQVATKELVEETGLAFFSVHPPIEPPRIFDLDIHEIPQYQDVPAHLHYDVRFLFFSSAQCQVRSSSESRDVRWVRLSGQEEYTREESLLRLRWKTRHEL